MVIESCALQGLFFLIFFQFIYHTNSALHSLMQVLFADCEPSPNRTETLCSSGIRAHHIYAKGSTYQHIFLYVNKIYYEKKTRYVRNLEWTNWDSNPSLQSANLMFSPSKLKAHIRVKKSRRVIFYQYWSRTNYPKFLKLMLHQMS